MSIGEQKMSAKELQLVINCSPKSKQLFIKQFIIPSVADGLLAVTHPDNPHHPQQKYYLTEIGLGILKRLRE